MVNMAIHVITYLSYTVVQSTCSWPHFKSSWSLEGMLKAKSYWPSLKVYWIVKERYICTKHKSWRLERIVKCGCFIVIITFMWMYWVMQCSKKDNIWQIMSISHSVNIPLFDWVPYLPTASRVRLHPTFCHCWQSLTIWNASGKVLELYMNTYELFRVSCVQVYPYLSISISSMKGSRHSD